MKLKKRYINSSEFGINNKIDDFSCPLCETKGNTFLPIYGNLSMYKTLNISNVEVKLKKDDNLIDQKLIKKVDQDFSSNNKNESDFKDGFKKVINLFLKSSNSTDALPTTGYFFKDYSIQL